MKSEAAVLSEIRLAASRAGWRLWRNNSGALQDPEGRLVRYGLANESAAINRMIKSADLIGIAPRVITPADLGRTIGQFVSLEAKAAGWSGARNERERAQERWRDLILSMGGFAIITGDPEALFNDPRA